jgi:hypothetical protein
VAEILHLTVNDDAREPPSSYVVAFDLTALEIADDVSAKLSKMNEDDKKRVLGDSRIVQDSSESRMLLLETFQRSDVLALHALDYSEPLKP